MALQVRTARDNDRQALHDLSQLAFAARSAPYDEASDRSATPLDRRLLATEGARIVGRLAVWELGQWFGGRRVPMGGVSGVAVAPDARGRGVASTLVHEAIRTMRDRGEVVSSLYPMNHTLYRRHGWEVAGSYPEQRLDLRALTSLPRPDTEVEVRPTTEADLPAIRELHEAVSREEPGNLSHGPEFGARRLLGHPGIQEGYVAEADGRLTGLLVAGRTDPTDDRGFYTITVLQLLAADLASELALLRVLAAQYPVAGTVTLVTPPQSALPMLVGERDLRPVDRGWCWMTRLVDAAGAIAARGYAPDATAEVHLHLDDPVARWNTGPRVLRVKDGAGHLEPGGRGDVRLGIGRLASLYTGWTSPHRLARLGLLTGADAADLAALDRVFAGRLPWSRDFF
ncbi:GNAT family N-acetyltransferase [Actinopolymorpha rutila]|uniref:Putative acetyltransferase n=1 Tax=Actinopolymorpha rutila TaxID=446787 RepID=A0A852ZK14_9ACTN|nr:GNAT family N-acetyltransferase [Actinopolymorpha rutila]NYH89530.1 putative acetyltransferase [Actinopolymorpha rutila]